MFGVITTRRHNEIVAEKDGEIAALRAELATTWVRNLRGHLVRHPSFVKGEGSRG